MSFAMQESVSVRLPSAAAAVHNFIQKTAVGSIRFTNTTASNKTINVWFDYNGTVAGATEQIQYEVMIPKKSSVSMPGVFVFSAGGRITASCSTHQAVTMHFTPATF
jgi:hypothetical protein